MIIRNDANERIDELTTIRVRKHDQPELFAVLDGCAHSGFQKVDWSFDREDEGNTIVIRVNNIALGGSHMTVEMTGMEMASLVEMMCPRCENPLQRMLFEQFSNAVGSPLLSFVYSATRNWERCAGKKCARRQDEWKEPLTGFAKAKGCFYEMEDDAPKVNILTDICRPPVVETPKPLWSDEKIEEQFLIVSELLTTIRNMLARHTLTKKQVNLTIRCPDDIGFILLQWKTVIETLAPVRIGQVGSVVSVPDLCVHATMDNIELFVALDGIDVEKELKNQRAERDKCAQLIESKRKKLSNEAFVARAPFDIVENERRALEEAEQQLATLSATITELENRDVCDTQPSKSSQPPCETGTARE